MPRFLSTLILSITALAALMALQPAAPCRAGDIDPVLEDNILDRLGEMLIYTRMLDRNSRLGNHPYEEAYDALKAIGKPALPYIEERWEAGTTAAKIMLFELACDIDAHGMGMKLARAGAEQGDWRVHKTIYDRLRPYRNNATLEIYITMLQRTDPGYLRTLLLETLFEWTGQSYGKDIEYWQSWWDDIHDVYDVEQVAQVRDVAAPGQVDNFTNLKVISKRVLFVIDISKSMQWGDKIRVAKRELIHVVENFTDDVSFNIIFFSGEVHSWKPDLVPATKKNKESAVKVIRDVALEAGTNTYGALVQALTGSADTIYFLSDGDPTEGDITDMPTIADKIALRNRLRRATFHCIGFFFGQPPPETNIPPTDFKKTEAFMRRMCDASGGSFLSVQDEK